MLWPSWPRRCAKLTVTSKALSKGAGAGGPGAVVPSGGVADAACPAGGGGSATGAGSACAHHAIKRAAASIRQDYTRTTPRGRLREDDQILPSLDGGALRAMHRGHLPGARRAQLILHLHGLEHDHRLP